MSNKVKLSEEAYVAMTNKIASETAYRILNDIIPHSECELERKLIYKARMAIIELKAMYALSLDITEEE